MPDDTIERAKAHFFAGNEHFEAGRFDAARADYEAALALVPGRASVLANLGVTLTRLGRWADAVPRLDAALLAEPTNRDAWAALGLCREAQGDWPGAVHALRQAIGLGAQQAGLWLALATCELEQDHEREGLQAIEQCLALDPTMGEAWSQRGTVMRRHGHLAEAARCFEQAIAHGADPELNRFYLAAVTDAREPPAPPALYARILFDRYADDFQDHVVEVLKYSAPQILLSPLLADGRRFRRVLDLGCGTGLCAQVLAPHADAIDGVDVADAMVRHAQASGLYRRVWRADVIEGLRDAGSQADGALDLIVAADVFIYVGPLDAVFAAAAQRLAPGGVFAFSVEQADAGRALQLRPSLRYAHGRESLEAMAAAHGLEVDAVWAAPIREDQAQPVMGWYLHLRKP